MFDSTSSTSLPAYSAATSSQAVKEDFGRLVRRIQQSNSGQFAPLKEIDTGPRASFSRAQPRLEPISSIGNEGAAGR